VIGFQYLKAMHLNDSKAGLNSKVDRHESIGLLPTPRLVQTSPEESQRKRICGLGSIPLPDE